MGRGSRKKPKSCKEGFFPLFCAILVCQQIRQTTGPSFNKGFRSFAPESEKNPEELASAKRHPNKSTSASGTLTILALLLEKTQGTVH